MPYASDGSFTRTNGITTGSTIWATEAAAASPNNNIIGSQFDTEANDFVTEVFNALGKWTTYSPTYAASGSMTFTSVTTNFAKYLKTGRRVEVLIDASGTTGGTASNNLQFSLPVSANVTSGIFIGQGGGIVTDNSVTVGSAVAINAATTAIIQRYDSGNYTLGAAERFRVHLVYEAA